MAENTKTDGISTAAWMTEEPKMLFFDRAEAESYCDDEEPDPLVRLSDAELLIAELREDLEESDAVRDRCAHLLAETAVALKGPEEPLHRHGWQDMAEVAAKLRTEHAQQAERIRELESERRRVYAFLDSTCEAGFADEVFRPAPNERREGILPIDSEQSDTSRECAGFTRQDKGFGQKDQEPIQGVTKRIATLEAEIATLKAERGESGYCESCNALAIENERLRNDFNRVNTWLGEKVEENALQAQRIHELARDLQTEIARNRPLQSLVKNQEETKSILLRKVNENKAAVATLDSERQANAELTERIAILEAENAELRKDAEA